MSALLVNRESLRLWIRSSLSTLSRTRDKSLRTGVSCSLPDAAVASSCLGILDPDQLIANLRKSVHRSVQGRRTSGSEPHADAPPKEEQHASPGGHLFSQVCSPSVIKIGATHPPSDAALVRQHHGCWGMTVRHWEQLRC